jgi:hypothetical protein
MSFFASLWSVRNNNHRALLYCISEIFMCGGSGGAGSGNTNANVIAVKTNNGTTEKFVMSTCCKTSC